MEKSNQSHGKGSHAMADSRKINMPKKENPLRHVGLNILVSYALLLQLQVGIGTFSCFFKLVGYQTQCLIVQLKEGY